MSANCAECDTTFAPKKASSRFCSSPCRKTWNNRRATRGAQLYDAFMSLRYDRAGAEAAGLDYKFVCRMGEMFHAEDAGRKSFRDVEDVMGEVACEVNARSCRA
tara:strand:+ start:140 stop:451 length:312 start_codon:yes stop_codon:yes gene_type:complete